VKRVSIRQACQSYRYRAKAGEVNHTIRERALYLNAQKPDVRLNLPDRGSITIRYDQLQFVIAETTGDVYINNRQALSGRRMPGSCVIALGSPEFPNLRRYITFDLSHPEIVL
jgi:serine/threonine-protein kinase